VPGLRSTLQRQHFRKQIPTVCSVHIQGNRGLTYKDGSSEELPVETTACGGHCSFLKLRLSIAFGDQSKQNAAAY
jgi:hypothetical protein